MNSGRFAAGTLVGGAVLYGVGYLIFNMAFAAFYAANLGSATGVDRSSQIIWAVSVGNLMYAALITYVLAQKNGGVTIGDGIKAGAIAGFLIWGTADFILYGATNISNLSRTVVDPLLEIVHGGVGGAAIALVLGKMSSPGK